MVPTETFYNLITTDLYISICKLSHFLSSFLPQMTNQWEQVVDLPVSSLRVEGKYKAVTFCTFCVLFIVARKKKVSPLE